MLEVMDKIKGVPVTLFAEEKTGTDEDGNDVYTEVPVVVEDVLIGEPTTDDITDSTNLYGKRVVYVLGIPKTDTNDWTNKKIEIFGELYRSFGFPMRGIDSNIPGHRSTKVRVERYE